MKIKHRHGINGNTSHITQVMQAIAVQRLTFALMLKYHYPKPVNAVN